MNYIQDAVRAGAFKQASEMLKYYRAGTLTHGKALAIYLSVGWDWEK